MCTVSEDAGILMERVRGRDVKAFESLYDAYHRLVYGVALRILSDEPSAQDVTTAVFLNVWSAPDIFRGGNFRAWILRMARSQSLDRLRSRSDRQDGELPEGPPEIDALEDIAFARLEAASIRTELARLPNDQREPIELGFFAGITYEEIARRTGTPLGTIKSRMRTGLRRLRSALNEAVTA